MRGENYGQGSSREHVALAPRYLGVRIKIARSFARIHRSNLINFGIVPLIFSNPEEYKRLNSGDRLMFPELRKVIQQGAEEISAACNNRVIKLVLLISDRERRCLIEGGLLNLVKKSLR